MTTLLQSRAVRTERFPNRHVDGRMSPQRAKEAAVLYDAFRLADSSTSKPQHDGYITSLKGRLHKGTVRLFDHLLLFARNWFERGARQEAVEAVFHTALAIVRGWYGEKDSTIELATLAKNETIAQANADVAEWDLANNPSPHVIAHAEAMCSVHLIQLSRLVQRLREMKHAQQLPPAA